MRTPTADELARLGLFAGLPAEGLEIFAKAAELRELMPGEEVYREGDRGDAIYIVADGRVRILCGTREAEVNALERGEFFGEMSFVDMQPRSATVRAESAALLWRWRYSTLGHIRKEDLKAFTLLFMNIAREISRRLRRADARMSS